MSSLRFPSGALEQLRATLLQDRPNEAAAMLLARRVDLDSGISMIVSDVIPVPMKWVKADPFRVDIAAEFIAQVLKRARLDELGAFFVHTHPSTQTASFSAQDDQTERQLMSTMFQRAPGGPHGAVVLSSSGCAARYYSSPSAAPVPLTVVEAGTFLRVWDVDHDAIDFGPTVERTIRAIGEPGQQRLTRARAGVVGLGGLGSIIAQQLAHLGVGHLVFIDPDNVDATNLNRLIGSTPESVGVPKVDVAARLIHSIRPTSTVSTIRGDVRFEHTARRLIDLDVVFCCTDSHGSRAILNQFAHQYFVPVIDSGVRIDALNGRIDSIVGRVQVLAPGLACLVCENLLDPEQVRRDLLTDEERRRDPYIVGAQEAQPSVISINGVVGSLAVTMFLSLMCGLPLESRHQVYLADRGTVRNVLSVPVPTCYVCSLGGASGRGDRWSMPWRRI